MADHAPLKIVFMGTPDFAVPSLRALLDDEAFDVILAVTMPDKGSGRGRLLKAPPVKEAALGRGLPVLQPARIRGGTVASLLREIAPDVIVVVAYGMILPKSILDLPRLGCVNLHASLLPAYRGASPINRAVMDGVEKTGITTMLMDTGMDTGPMLLAEELDIKQGETAGKLFERLSVLGGPLLVKTLKGLAEGAVKPIPQPQEGVSHAPMMKKEDGRIDWSKSALEIDRLVRGVTPWPGAYTTISGRIVKIHGGQLNDLLTNVVTAAYGKDSIDKDFAPGTIFYLFDGHLLAGCGCGEFYEITELQAEGKKRMLALDFIRGSSIKTGDRFE